MKYYLAGPMTGLPDFNYPAFARAATQLRAQLYRIESPHEGHGEADQREPGSARGYEDYLRAALQKLLMCEAIILLPGWDRSKGAALEYQIAAALKMPVYTSSPDTGQLTGTGVTR